MSSLEQAMSDAADQLKASRVAAFEQESREKIDILESRGEHPTLIAGLRLGAELGVLFGGDTLMPEDARDAIGAVFIAVLSKVAVSADEAGVFKMVDHMMEVVYRAGYRDGMVRGEDSEGQ